jgi:pilus assembly protein TadC
MMHRINIDESRANLRLGQQSKELAEQSKELGELTAILARQTSADSASMITVAVMTMFFLPATFISVRSHNSCVIYAWNANMGSHCLATASLSLMIAGYSVFQIWSGFTLPLLSR